MYTPKVLHRALQIGDRDRQHSVLNTQSRDLVSKKFPDGIERRPPLAILLCLERPKHV